MYQRVFQTPERLWLCHTQVEITELIAHTVMPPMPLSKEASCDAITSLYAAYANARFRSAHSRADLLSAQNAAYACQMAAGHGSQAYTWALFNIASISVSLGQPQVTLVYGHRFLAHVHQFPNLYPFIPKVLRGISHVYFRRRQYTLAIRLRRQALALFRAQGNREAALRTACNLVWALVLAGRVKEARRALPRYAPLHLKYILQGALAVLLVAEGKFDQAVETGKAALAAPRPLYDALDGAAVAEILSRVAERRGLRALARSFKQQSKALATLQGQPEPDLSVRLVLVAPVIPFWPVAPTLVAGERNGACFTTGVA